jgi:glycosyltransferase involved in cell wall biosynthesis
MMARSDLPLVAILTPVYNGEKYLHETMLCVQESDYPNLIHVILDNASTDETAKIIESYRHGGVPLLVRRNPKTIPMIANFNAVASLAPEETRYMRLLCADDLMSPSAISKMVAIAERDESIGMVGCLCRNVGLLGEELPGNQAIFDGNMIARAYLRRETNFLSGTHLLYRRKLFDGAEPPYDSRMGASVDADTAIRVALAGRVGFVPEVLAEYRHHDASHSALVAARNGGHLFEWLLLLDKYGPQVMTPVEYARCRRLYRRYYLRRALLASARERDLHFLRLQRSRLAVIGDAAGPTDFAGALIEWAYFAMTGQRHRVGAPKRMIFDAPRYPQLASSKSLS